MDEKYPKVIYLQKSEDEDCYPDGESNAGVTWCPDKINNTDVEYVRANTLTAQQKAIDELMAVCEKIIKKKVLDVIVPTLNNLPMRELKAKLRSALAVVKKARGE